MLKGEANLTIGSHGLNETRYKILAPKDAYIFIQVGFIYKEQNRRLIAVASILTPFHSSVWIAIFVIISCSMVIILMTKRFTRKWRHFLIGGRMNRTPILNAWHTVLGGSIPNPQIANARSFGNFSRTLTILWITMWFFIKFFYEGALYNNMQGNQPPSPYDTTEKVLASNCKILVDTSPRSLATFIDEKRYIQVL